MDSWQCSIMRTHFFWLCGKLGQFLSIEGQGNVRSMKNKRIFHGSQRHSRDIFFQETEVKSSPDLGLLGPPWPKEAFFKYLNPSTFTLCHLKSSLSWKRAQRHAGPFLRQRQKIIFLSKKISEGKWPLLNPDKRPQPNWRRPRESFFFGEGFPFHIRFPAWRGTFAERRIGERRAVWYGGNFS